MSYREENGRVIKRYGDGPNYGQGPDRLRNRVDWVKTMHANLATTDQTREFMVRLISLIECDISDTSFEKRVLDVLKATKNPRVDHHENWKQHDIAETEQGL